MKMEMEGPFWAEGGVGGEMSSRAEKSLVGKVCVMEHLDLS